jgi:small-conductance mechanosensitive channel
MERGPLHHTVRKQLWRHANIKLLPSGILFVFGLIISGLHGGYKHAPDSQKIIAVFGIILFVFFAFTFLQVLTKTISRLVSMRHLNVGRAAALQFILRLIGNIAIFIVLLDLIGIPVGKLLLGGAALGIILGVAAQQALANLFASIVIIVAHPYSVGQTVTIRSGGLGGEYVGKIKDIGLTHTKLQLENDNTTALLPNAALLSGATILINKHPS